ncbi:MAG: FG-GAP repeat protein [Magnetococcales bacterium]|nr:FG-GAP repeat protein [Magnetococcales bacterium]
MISTKSETQITRGFPELWSKSIQLSVVDGSATLLLPNASFLLEGEYVRAGADLVITNPSGEEIRIKDYFAQAHPPALILENGSALTFETIEALALPEQGPVMLAGSMPFPGSEEAGPVVGTAQTLVGRVMARGKNGIVRLLREGDPIQEGDLVRTAEDSLAKFVMKDGTIFQVGENARALLDEYRFQPDAALGKFEATVLTGMFRYASGQLAHLKEGRHSTIKTPSATIGIRGSELQGEVAQNGGTMVVHTAGVLDIADAFGQGSVTLLQPGQATAVQLGGGPPQAPFQAPPGLMARLQSQVSEKSLSTAKEKEQTQRQQEEKQQDQPREGEKKGGEEKKGDAPEKGGEAPKGEGEKGGKTDAKTEDSKESKAEDTKKGDEKTTEEGKGGKSEAQDRLDDLDNANNQNSTSTSSTDRAGNSDQSSLLSKSIFKLSDQFDPTIQFSSSSNSGSATDSKITTFQFAQSDSSKSTNINLSIQTNTNPATENVKQVITVTNLPPLSGTDQVTVNQNDAWSISAASLLANDKDPEGATLSIDPEGFDFSEVPGHFTILQDGSLLYSADGELDHLAAGDSLTTAFFYTVWDQSGQGAIGTAVMVISGVNDAPLFDEETYSFSGLEDSTVSGQLVATDVDDGDTLTFTVSTSALHGVVTIDADGQFLYTPVANYFGPDSFVVTVSDEAGATDTATVNLHLGDVADGTLRANNDSLDLDLGTTGYRMIPFADILSNDSSPTGSPLTSLTVTAATNAVNGTIHLGNGHLLFQPDTDFEGYASFDYTVSDSTGATSSATVTIKVSLGGVLDLSTRAYSLASTYAGTSGVKWAGETVAHLGDFNGDGYGDMLLSAEDSYGAAYVLFGSSAGFSSLIGYTSVVNGSAGMQLSGASPGGFDGNVAAAGDFNADGLMDLIVGSPYADDGILTDVGQAYIVFGQESFSPTNPGIASLLDGEGAAGLIGMTANERLGSSVAGIGDFNGDGYDDVAVGSGGSQGTGNIYVLFGHADPLANHASLAGLNGSNGFTLVGDASLQDINVLSGADINGDGYSDLLVGVGKTGNTATDPGKAFVVFGGAAVQPSLIASSFNGTDGFTITGLSGTEGLFFRQVGDVNGDGFTDSALGHIIVEGGYKILEAFVVYGGASTLLDANIDLTSLDGSNGFMMRTEAGRTLGFEPSVNGVGDVNGDGYDDLLVLGNDGYDISVTDYFGTYNMAVYTDSEGYLIYGRGDGFPAELVTSDLTAPYGFTILPSDTTTGFGYVASQGGDLDGDGYDDLLLGLPNQGLIMPTGVSLSQTLVVPGSAQIVWGDNFSLAVTLEGTDGNDVLTEGGTRDVIVAGQGNDIIDGGGGDDSIRAGSGDDTVAYYADASRIDGGEGIDILRPGISDLDIAFDALHPVGLLASIEGFDLTGYGANTLTLSARDIASLVENDNTLTIRGDAADTLILNGSFSYEGTRSAGDDTYRVYFYEGVSLWVSLAVATSSYASPIERPLDLLNGFAVRFTGTQEYGASGIGLAGGFDINGDGFDDIAIGVPNSNYVQDTYSGYGGSVYVVFGQSGDYGHSVALDDVLADGVSGFKVLNGSNPPERMGIGLAGVGDVNGDGRDELLMAAGNSSAHATSDEGNAYLFSSLTSLTATVTLESGSNGRSFHFPDGSPSTAFSLYDAVAGAGDFNGDGFADFIIGSPNFTPSSGSDKAGAVAFVMGRPGGMDVSNLFRLNGQTGFYFKGQSAGQGLGYAVASAGDFNGDGFDDALVGGAPSTGGGRQAYLVLGGDRPYSLAGNVSTLLSNSYAKAFNGAAGYSTGLSVSSAGDFNGDGYDDFILGAPYMDASKPGKAYLLFGGASRPSYVGASGLNGSNGFAIAGEDNGDDFGWAVAGVGDINGDGYDDVAIGAPSASDTGNAGGKVYVLFGNASGWTSSFSINTLNGNNGFTFHHVQNDSNFGSTLSAAGDVNGDGYSDFLIGARTQDVNGVFDVGVTYLVYGTDFTGTVTGHGTPLGETLTGAAGISDSLIGGGGNDSLDGLGGLDVLYGGSGDDLLKAYSIMDHIDGGSGKDMVQWMEPTNLNLNGNHFWQNIEAIDLTYSTSAQLGINPLDVLRIATNTHSLQVRGGSGNAVVAASGWSYLGSQTIDGLLYHDYYQEGAILEVQDGIDRQGIATYLNVDKTASPGTRQQFFLLKNAYSGNAYLGQSASSAGDFNGDGFDDFVLGAPGQEAVYVVFGNGGAFPEGMNVSTLSGSKGFKITTSIGTTGFGKSVAGVGDVNGDGFDDLLIGAPNTNVASAGTNEGQAILLFGGNATVATTLTLAAGSPASHIVFTGAVNNVAGFSVSGAGDFNHDGYDDFIIGASGGSSAYLIFGKSTFSSGAVTLSALPTDGSNGANALQLSGAGETLGAGVAGIGDVNGDGWDDIALGAPLADPTSTDAGKVYVLFGTQAGVAGFGPTLDLVNWSSNNTTGSQGFVINGMAASDELGKAIHGIGDFNGDGVDDFVVGSSNNGANGTTWLIYGKAGGFAPTLSLASLSSADGLSITDSLHGVGNGWSVSGAGDFNGDGLEDLVIGDPGASANVGASYILFGSKTSLGASFDLNTLDGTKGFLISDFKSDQFGFSVSGGGDLNGDGFDDLVIGARSASGNNGNAYVLFGHSMYPVGDVSANTQTGTGSDEYLLGGNGKDAISGEGGSDILVGRLGHDTLDGGAGSDILLGGGGNDILYFDGADARVDGGANFDALSFAGTGQSLDLRTATTTYENLEIIDLNAQSGSDALYLPTADLLHLSSGNLLLVAGGTADTLYATQSDWSVVISGQVSGSGMVFNTDASGQTTYSGEVYNVYNGPAGTPGVLLVDTDILYQNLI